MLVFWGKLETLMQGLEPCRFVTLWCWAADCVRSELLLLCAYPTIRFGQPTACQSFAALVSRSSTTLLNLLLAGVLPCYHIGSVYYWFSGSVAWQASICVLFLVCRSCEQLNSGVRGEVLTFERKFYIGPWERKDTQLLICLGAEARAFVICCSSGSAACETSICVLSLMCRLAHHRVLMPQRG